MVGRDDIITTRFSPTCMAAMTTILQAAILIYMTIKPLISKHLCNDMSLDQFVYPMIL